MSETDDQTEAPAPEASDEALKTQLAEAEARAADNWEKFLRASAELENVRRRAERETSSAHKYGQERLLGELLLIADSLDLGLKAAEAPNASVQALSEGLKLTHRQLAALLEKNGVRPEDPQGQPFDPERHEAVSMLESTEVPAQHVVSVMQKGYLLHDRVLRPAMVVVARAPEPSEAARLNDGGPSPDNQQS